MYGLLSLAYHLIEYVLADVFPCLHTMAIQIQLYAHTYSSHAHNTFYVIHGMNFMYCAATLLFFKQYARIATC